MHRRAADSNLHAHASAQCEHGCISAAARHLFVSITRGRRPKCSPIIYETSSTRTLLRSKGSAGQAVPSWQRNWEMTYHCSRLPLSAVISVTAAPSVHALLMREASAAQSLRVDAQLLLLMTVLESAWASYGTCMIFFCLQIYFLSAFYFRKQAESLKSALRRKSRAAEVSL